MRTAPINNGYKAIHAFNRVPGPDQSHLKIKAGYSNEAVKQQRPDDFLQEIFSTRLYTDQPEGSAYSFNKEISSFEPRLCLPSQKGFTIVKLKEIICCEAQRSYTKFHFLNSRSITVSKPLFDYERLLTGTAFLRIHKSFFVNLLHVNEYSRGDGGTVIMSNGMEIDVSRRKKEQFLVKVREFFKY